MLVPSPYPPVLDLSGSISFAPGDQLVSAYHLHICCPCRVTAGNGVCVHCCPLFIPIIFTWRALSLSHAVVVFSPTPPQKRYVHEDCERSAAAIVARQASLSALAAEGAAQGAAAAAGAGAGAEAPAIEEGQRGAAPNGSGTTDADTQKVVAEGGGGGGGSGSGGGGASGGKLEKQQKEEVEEAKDEEEDDDDDAEEEEDEEAAEPAPARARADAGNVPLAARTPATNDRWDDDHVRMPCSAESLIVTGGEYPPPSSTIRFIFFF